MQINYNYSSFKIKCFFLINMQLQTKIGVTQNHVPSGRRKRGRKHEAGRLTDTSYPRDISCSKKKTIIFPIDDVIYLNLA